MRLVINIAKNYHSPLIPFEDLVQEGAIGLVTATERFDPARGFPLQHLRDLLDPTVDQPRHRQQV